MKKDIKNREDIEWLVNNFYDKVRADKLISHFFTEAVQVNWKKHLPLMYDFWENIVFFTGAYEGNPMTMHHHLSKITTLKKIHFKRWNKLFTQSVDELFEGEKAELIKSRAARISAILQNNIFSK